MHDETKPSHLPSVELVPTNKPLVYPIYQSAKFTFGSWADMSQGKREDVFIYSRDANPTVRQLEHMLAALQGRKEGVAVASGLGAIATTMATLLSHGDHVVMFLDSYKPSRLLLKGLFAKFGVTSSFFPIDDLDAVEKEIAQKKTKMLLFEGTTNPMTRVPDIDRVLSIAKKHGVITVLDNTFSGFHNYGQYPVDLYIHSLTKFAGGHGDVMGGVIIGEGELIAQVRAMSILLGPTLDPHAAYLVLRGMQTYTMRYRAHCENALQVARFLEGRADVERLFYPGLASHPDHALARKQMNDFGSVVTVTLKPSVNLQKFVDGLQLFKLAPSLGSPESLIAPTQHFYGADLTAQERERMGMTERTLRLSLGIENAQDLVADLAHALALGGAR